MASITTSVVLLRWPLVSAVLMFLAFAGVATLIKTTCLLGITLLDIAKIWGNIKDVMIEVMSQTPPEWPMMMT